ncbi:probable transcription factor At1g61730 [Argentina anserina]|uniref:probable transcription factor At1g61730 n=1 Tax=Argentina anserina TaxID=57926 RepID=UPI0021765C7D|nr:probable transcription factor At1g61730 [Potentilla anserina]
MAPPHRNRPSPLEIPSSASSSEVEVTDSGSVSNTEQPNDTTAVVTPLKNTKPQKNHVKKTEASPSKPWSSSSSSSGVGTTTVHAVAASKPMQDSNKSMHWRTYIESSGCCCPHSNVLHSMFSSKKQPVLASFSLKCTIFPPSYSISLVHISNRPPLIHDLGSATPKTRSKSAARLAAAKPGTKRPVADCGGDVEVLKGSKKAKKEVKAEKKVKDAEDKKVRGKEKEAEEEEAADVKKGRGLFQMRLWSDEDEIKLVKGMMEYVKVKRGADPVVDVDSFYEFVTPLLTVSVNKSQLQDKARRMKKKYENIARNKFKPTKDHDWEAYSLMKKVWGGGEDEARKVEEGKKEDQNGTGKAKGVASFEPLKEPNGSVGVGVGDGELNGGGGIVKGFNEGGGFVKGFNGNGGFLKGLNELGGWENFVNQGMKLVDEAKGAEVNCKWKELHLLELELFIKKTQVMGDQAKLILEALKSSDN